MLHLTEVEYLTIIRSESLPFSTKRSLALDVANGLQVLHRCGVIHGDMKPENILVFESGSATPRAKIADFGHSILDEGTDMPLQLMGGTQGYSSPEWQSSAPFRLLKRTDVYSYGLVFTSIMLGADVVDSINRKYEPGTLNFFKQGDLLHTQLCDIVHTLDDPTLDDVSLIKHVIRSTLKMDPNERSLDNVITRLSLM